MSNGFKTNGKIANVLIGQHNQFLQEQLMESQQSLFFARSVKEAKFLQSRIEFLKSQLKTTKSNGRSK